MSRLVIRRTSGLITAKVSLNVLERIAKCVPMFGEQVSQLVKAASDIVSTVEKHRLNQAANDDLARKVVRTLEITALALREPGIAKDRIPKLKSDLEEIETIIFTILDQLQRHYALHRYERVIMTITAEDVEMTKGFCDKLDEAMQRFNYKTNIQMRLGLQQVQDMLELGLIGIGDIRSTLAADKQARATIDAERTGPCSCRSDGGERAIYECKHCLLEAINGSGEISEEELRYNQRYFGDTETEEPASYSHPPTCSHRAPSQRGIAEKKDAPVHVQEHQNTQTRRPQHKADAPPKYSSTGLHISTSTFLKPPRAAPPMSKTKPSNTNSFMRSPPSTTFSPSSTNGDESVPPTPADILPDEMPRPNGHKIVIPFPMPAVPLYRYHNYSYNPQELNEPSNMNRIVG